MQFTGNTAIYHPSTQNYTVGDDGESKVWIHSYDIGSISMNVTFTFTAHDHQPHPVFPGLSSVTIYFHSAAGDNDQGKDHDTEMWVYLLDNANNRVAQYIEQNTWVGGGVPTLGANYPQGVAPNTDVPRGMRVNNPSKKADLSNAQIAVHWRPRGGLIGGPHDWWTTLIHIEIIWDDGTADKTKEVRYDLGSGEMDENLPVKW